MAQRWDSLGEGGNSLTIVLHTVWGGGRLGQVDKKLGLYFPPQGTPGWFPGTPWGNTRDGVPQPLTQSAAGLWRAV